MGAKLRQNAIACVAVLAGSCGGLGSSPKVRDGAAPFGTGVVSDFANQYLSVVCQRDVACHAASSIDGCRADLSASWGDTYRRVQGEIDSGRIIYNADRADACMDFIQTAACPSFSNGGYHYSLGWRGIFQGTFTSGDACVWDIECASGHCRWDPLIACASSCCLGICAPPGDVGANCATEAFRDCVDAAYCQGPAPRSDGTCRARLAQGEACSAWLDSPCQEGLTCDDGSHVCVPYPKDGQPCSDNGPPCDNRDSYCDTNRGTCQARGQVGAPCVYYIRSCVGYAQCVNGICTPMPGAGDLCTLPDGGYSYGICRWDATLCTDGICQDLVQPPCTIEIAQQQAVAAP